KAEHLAPAVAHEDGGRPPQAEVVREKAETGEADAEREYGDEVAWVNGVGVDREERARDRGQRRGEPVHVVEQVERVRHSDDPENADRSGRDVVAYDLHPDPAGQDERGRRQLCAELRKGREMEDVVQEAGEVKDRTA